MKFDLPTLGRYDEDAPAEEKKSAARLVEGLGGMENILTIDNCATRLRLTVKDISKVDEKILTAAGAKGVFMSGNGVQVVIGTQVEFVADEIKSLRTRE